MSESDVPVEDAKPGPLLRLLHDQRVTFLIVGGINTAVGFGTFVAADLLIGRVVDRAAGTVVGSWAVLGISHVLSVLIAFILHRRFVFRVRGHVLRDLARFESVYLTSLGVNAVLLPLLVAVGLPRIGAQALVVFVTTMISWFGHRYFSFRRSGTERADDAAKRLVAEEDARSRGADAPTLGERA